MYINTLTLQLYYIFIIEWGLVAEKKECSGSEIHIAALHVVDECASRCKGVASMFVFGTNDYGEARCWDEGCSCYCETSATEEGTCSTVNHRGYRLYKYGITTLKGSYHALQL